MLAVLRYRVHRRPGVSAHTMADGRTRPLGPPPPPWHPGLDSKQAEGAVLAMSP